MYELDDKSLDDFVSITLDKVRHISSYLASQFAILNHTGSRVSDDVETQADRYVARYWLDFLTAHYPTFNVDTEETLGKLDKGSDYTVRIDSIDGSKHFEAGIPLFSSNLSLEHKGSTLFAVCVLPMSGEIYHAVGSRGAFLNDKPISVSTVETLEKSFVVCENPTPKLAKSNPAVFAQFQAALGHLLRSSFRVRNFGLGGFGLCLVARGACSAYIDLSGTTKRYDVAAAAFILQAAGGQLSDLNHPGPPAELTSALPTGYGLVATNGKVHSEVLSVLREQSI